MYFINKSNTSYKVNEFKYFKYLTITITDAGGLNENQFHNQLNKKN